MKGWVSLLRYLGNSEISSTKTHQLKDDVTEDSGMLAG